MPLCAKCAKPLTREGKGEKPIGEVVFGCPLRTKPGASWGQIHGDAGINLAKVLLIEM
jgi:hypothetical protein